MTRLFTVAATLADGDFLQAAGRSRSSSTPPPSAIRFMTEVFILLEVSGAERLYCFVQGENYVASGNDRNGRHFESARPCVQKHRVPDHGVHGYFRRRRTPFRR